MDSGGMSLITVQYVPTGWLWGAPIEPTIGFISSGKLACLIIVLSSQVD